MSHIPSSTMPHAKSDRAGEPERSSQAAEPRGRYIGAGAALGAAAAIGALVWATCSVAARPKASKKAKKKGKKG